ncbi:PadR family transcriptional regulator [Micromonospora sp. C72]|uniref:PadR family transcriptional regulator n=1 Tax=Micromonospora sp. C72 TaxID=2824880 RepID=UPI001B394B6A|nr:PadR family transcriptional regulator [Micromonospora sp. C72]
MRPGTLYGALDRLVEAGMVEVHREEIVDGRLHRYYRLSPAGDTVVVEETARLRRNVEAAATRLRGRSRSTRLAPQAVGGIA